MPRHALLAALGAIVLWGLLAALSLRLRAWPPFLLVGAALLVGSLCGLHGVREWRVRPGVAALGVYGLFGFHFLLFMALRLAPPVEANLVNYLWPLLMGVLAPAILPGVTVGARPVAGACAGFAGAALLVTGGGFRFDAAHAAGYALALGSALVWATYSLPTKSVTAFPTGAIGLAWLAALGLGPMGAAFFLWDHALKHGDPRRIGALAHLTPLLSTLALVAVGAGALTPATLAAVALIVGGAALGTRG